MPNQLSNKTIIILAIGLFLGISMSLLSIFITGQHVQAQGQSIQQSDPEDTRIFQLSRDFLSTIDQSFYINGEPVSASGAPLPEITIFGWSNIRTTDKASIQAVANADDWTDITCIVKVCV